MEIEITPRAEKKLEKKGRVFTIKKVFYGG